MRFSVPLSAVKARLSDGGGSFRENSSENPFRFLFFTEMSVWMFRFKLKNTDKMLRTKTPLLLVQPIFSKWTSTLPSRFFRLRIRCAIVYLSFARYSMISCRKQITRYLLTICGMKASSQLYFYPEFADQHRAYINSLSSCKLEWIGSTTIDIRDGCETSNKNSDNEGFPSSASFQRRCSLSIRGTEKAWNSWNGNGRRRKIKSVNVNQENPSK